MLRAAGEGRVLAGFRALAPLSRFCEIIWATHFLADLDLATFRPFSPTVTASFLPFRIKVNIFSFCIKSIHLSEFIYRHTYLTVVSYLISYLSSLLLFLSVMLLSPYMYHLSPIIYLSLSIICPSSICLSVYLEENPFSICIERRYL